MKKFHSSSRNFLSDETINDKNVDRYRNTTLNGYTTWYITLKYFLFEYLTW